MEQSIIIGIAGGSGSGKTTSSKLLREKLGGGGDSLILFQDRYYIDQSQHFDQDGGIINFDHPSAIDFDLMAEQLGMLKKGHSIEAPRYDFATHTRLKNKDLISPRHFIIVDGILILSQQVIREQLDYRCYVDAPEQQRFERRLERDVRERGRSPKGVKRQIYQQVKPMHDQFVEPSKQYAHIILRNSKTFDELSQQLDQIISGQGW